MSAALVTDAPPSTTRGLGLRSGTRYLSAGLAFLALASIAIGCFLPAADAGSVTSERLHGNSLRASGIAWLTVALCVVVAAALARSLYTGRRTLGPLAGGLLVMTQAAYIGAAELTTCPVGAAALDSAVCETASPGIGLSVLAAGGAALAVAGLQLARLEASRPKAVAATEDGHDRLSAQLAAYSLHPSTALQYQTLEELQQALLGRDGHVQHEAEFKGYCLYMTETVFVASGRSHDHGFEVRDGEWVPFTPDTRPLDLEWILTLVNAAEWKSELRPGRGESS
jgi:hypothetical protein